MIYLRKTWPETRITPKFHMFEDHVIPFLSSQHVCCGYGLNKVLNQYTTNNLVKSGYKCSIKKGTERLTYIMKEHLAPINPASRCIRRGNAKKPRNLERNAN